MSLEAKIETLSVLIGELIKTLDKSNVTSVTPPVAHAPAVVSAAPPAAPIPVVTPAPVVAAAPIMPPPPVFATAQTPPAGAVPFSDSQSLIAYTMAAYKQLGGVKGAGIQNVLTSLGASNLTDVKPEMYAQFHAGIEALKAQG